MTRVGFEFVVTRRLPWETAEGPGDSVAAHLAAAVAALGADAEVERVEVDDDLDRVMVRVVVAVDDLGERTWDRSTPRVLPAAEDRARHLLSDAIRRAGGLHEGLLAVTEEARLPPRSSPWAGLRTPHWYLRDHGVVAEEPSRGHGGSTGE